VYVVVHGHAITDTNFGIVLPFQRPSSEISSLFANQGLVSIHADGYGGITSVTEYMEIHWRELSSLLELAKSSYF
jgi:hypothetical protein